jgi:catechol 2,3-dioxygenase-like lactoylglutathione lyase family enzyme
VGDARVSAAQLDHVVISVSDWERSNGFYRDVLDAELGPIERHGRGGPGVSVYFRDPDGSLLEFISYS